MTHTEKKAQYAAFGRATTPADCEAIARRLNMSCIYRHPVVTGGGRCPHLTAGLLIARNGRQMAQSQSLRPE